MRKTKTKSKEKEMLKVGDSRNLLLPDEDFDDVGMVAPSSNLPVTQMMEDGVMISNFGACSHIGMRSNQQDSSVVGSGDSVSPEFSGKFIAAVCDGMGGLEGGEIASSICAKTFYEDFFSNPKIQNYPDFFKDEIDKIDSVVSELKKENGEPMRAGSTFVGIIFDKGLLYWASVGDSHIYIVRGSEIIQVNRDHNYYMLLKEKVKMGEMTEEEASSHAQKEALISYIGMNGVKIMDVNEKPFPLLPDDCVVLCSDGLYRLLSNEEITNILLTQPYNMHEAAKTMVEAANSKMSPRQDNTTVIIFKYA